MDPQNCPYKEPVNRFLNVMQDAVQIAQASGLEIEGDWKVMCPKRSECVGCPSSSQEEPKLQPSNHAQTVFSGDVCPNCGGANLVQSGSCKTCHDCGYAGGCG